MLSHALLPKLHDVTCTLSAEGSVAVQAPHLISSCSSILTSTIGTKSFRGNFQKSFLGNVALFSGQQSCATNCDRITSFPPRAIVATDPAADEVIQEFTLEERLQLRTKALGASEGSPARVEFQVENCPFGSLLLHWGLTKHGQRDWILPSPWPEGTRDYKHKALQTPFSKAGDVASLTIDVWNPDFEAIEFLLKDESSNKWFKLHGGNFRVRVPKSKADLAQIAVPEKLVEIQAYLLWERKGKQIYTPEQEKEEYEEARKELQMEVAQGTSIETLQIRLLGGGAGDTASGGTSTATIDVPEDLVQVQAYLRWEKAGKPNFSPEEQLREYEAARKEIKAKLESGVSVEELGKQLRSGSGESSRGSVGVANYRPSTVSHIQRRKRDASDLINYYPSEKVEFAAAAPTPSRELTPLELGANVMEGLQSGAVLERMLFKLDGNDLLVLVTNPGEQIHVWLASALGAPLILHWAVSKSSDGEWQTPPENILPPNSTVMEGSCESPFREGFAGEPSLQSLEICVSDAGILGIPFVIRSGEQWIKNKGFDFYIPLKRAEKKKVKDLGDGKGTAKWLLEEIANRESDAERSLMHRFSIAAELTERAKDAGESALAGILVWMRFMATRQLVWNKNYNVKPREISAAQDRLTDLLQAIFRDQPQHREIVRLIMSTVGRGGQGDVGQRIRDEILVIQRKNDCKGAMMEEWHQKLHNNTSPDDVIICQALLDYIQNGFNIKYYWNTLNSNGVTKERLASYDRPIVSEPCLRSDQKDGLIRDLTAYLRTLKAVHSGADLESAIATCMGYSAKGEGFMGGVEIHPISGLSPELPALLRFVMDHIEDSEVIPLLEGLLEARRELRPTLLKPHDRLRDIIFLDLALDSTVRTVVERGLEGLINAEVKDIVAVISMVLENLCLSSDNNEELVYCLKDWHIILDASRTGGEQWAMHAKAVLDRTRLALAGKAEHYQAVLQPTAIYLGGLLGVDQWAVDIFTEEMIRAGSAAALSQLLNRLDPVLRSAANLGSWQVISPVEVSGHIVVVGDLGEVQDKVYDKPTIIVANRVKGEEEIPDGAVAVLTPDMPDVLSHVSVRARNSKVCFATCFDPNILSDLQSMAERFVRLQPVGADLLFREISDTEASENSTASTLNEKPLPGLSLKKKSFGGNFAVAADEFNSDLVGAKSRNIAYLRGKLPSWIKVPASVALPFGVFEKVLSEDVNKDVAREIASLSKLLDQGDISKLQDIRKTVLLLQAPHQLVEDLKTKMKCSNMPWPGDEGNERWEQAWTSIKKVWASKWNERAYFSTRKVGINHNDLCMAVLVQEIIRADYAYVIHTTNPSNEDVSEIYAEVVKGLGETLVGAYSGRALSFVAKKSNLESPKIMGYPSKRIGLFINESIIFRSDSNGEDLEGYAGAGLYDSVPMDEEVERVVDYSSDPLVVDQNFQKSILAKIAVAGAAVEELYGSAQDIEGVIKDGELYIVQTRPQM